MSLQSNPSTERAKRRSVIVLPSIVAELLSIGTLVSLYVGAQLCAAAAVSLSIQKLPSGQVQVVWPADAASFSLEQADSLTSHVPWRAAVGTVVSAGGQFSVLVQPSVQSRFYRLRSGATAAAAIMETSPAAGEGGVAVTRETILRFSEALAEGTSLSVDLFQALFGGRRILSRTELSSDRRTATLFYLENLPASATITVRFDGNGIRNAKGTLLDADGDGTEGGVFTMQFNTLGNTPLDGTGVVGQVFASEIGPGGTNRPLKGVTITVDGAEQTLLALTDASGFFHLNPSPAGRFFVHIDGRTAAGSAWPNGAYYPTVGKAWEAAPGKSDNLAGGNGMIFLPLIPADALQPVSAMVDTVIKVSSSVVSTNPAFANVSITVPANSLYSDNGTRGGRVGLAPVPPNRLPEPLPPGLEMPIVLTVQTDGPLNFDRPVPVCFPNLPDPVLGTPLPPDSKQSLIAFNHDKGRWEAVGTMTASADGKLICSDPGSGILQPGWLGAGPSPFVPKPVNIPSWNLPKNDGDDDDDDDDCEIDADVLEACFMHFKENYENCRRAVQLTFKEGMDYCNLNPKHTDPVWYSACVARQNDDYANGMAVCFKDRFDGTGRCKLCFGVPVPLSVNKLRNPRVALAINAGIDDLLDAKFNELVALLSQEPLPSGDALAVAVEEILNDLDALTGNDVRGFLLNSIIRLEREQAAAGPVRLFETGSAPPYPVRYAAHVLRPSGDFYMRGQTEAFLNYQIFVPRDGLLVRVDFYDPVRNRLGLITPDFRPEAPYGLPRALLHPVSPDEVDTDGDGLVDFAEHVYGTDATLPDTDGDGVPDGAEVKQGTNPLDNVPMGLGPIASVQTLGSAVDVAAFNSLALAAEGTAGVSVFDTRNSFNPVRIAQVDTPGNARAVAMEGTLAAVADGNAGLAILNLATPSNPSILRQLALSGEAVAVAVADGLAYVGLANGRVSVVEMASGQAFETVLLGVDSLADVLILGDALYVLAARRLFVLPLNQGTLQPLGSVASPGGSTDPTSRRLRLTGGGDLLYAASGSGFNVFSLANPLAPVLVQQNLTQQLGWKQIAPNGSGLGVAVVGINPEPKNTDDIFLNDLNPGGTNGVFLTRLTTPGIANALSIYNGLAYVADGPNGLLVLNYTEADTKKFPPKVELSASFPLGTNSQAPSASPARVRANVSDDVQVRNVEFYLDGQLIATDGNFPFEVRFVTPLLTATNTNFTVRARAFDTGGNSASSEMFTVNLVPDTTPPKVRHVSPTGGGRVIDRITAYFTEGVDAGKLNANSFQILSAGADGQLNTADDAILMNANYSVRAENFSASALFPQPLPDGLYRVTLTTGITDRNNNPLSPPISWDFRVGNASFWTGPFTGSWQDPANWSTGAVPGTNDDVIVDVSYGSGRIIVEDQGVARKLELFEEVEVLRGGSLEAIESLTAHRDVIPNGGVIRNTVFNLVDGAVIRPDRTVGSTLQNVIVNGDIRMGTSAWLEFLSGLTLNGTLSVATGGAIFGDNLTMTNGTILFAGNPPPNQPAVMIAQRATVIWGPGVVVRGRSGIIYGAGTLINQGKISVDGTGEHIFVHPVVFTHDGTAEVLNGAQLTFGSSGGTDWNGGGIINVLNGTFSLGGQFGPITTPITSSADGIVRITGNGNLQTSTLTLNAMTGSWILDGGTLRNGILNLIEGASLRPSQDDGVLEEMTVNGNLALDSGGSGILNFRNGLSLNGTLLLGTNRAIRFFGSQTMTNGTIEFAGALQGSGVPQVSVQNGGTVTFGTGVLIRGSSGNISGAGTLINQGKISADVFGGTIRINPANFVNLGILEAINGGALIAPQFP